MQLYLLIYTNGLLVLWDMFSCIRERLRIPPFELLLEAILTSMIINALLS